jgi:prepilin-type N-terminal cleavage/methylation domain-containing protein
MSRNREGFTLIELMVVIVIIGIIAAIAIPNYLKIVTQAKEAEVKANMHTAQLEVEYYRIDPGGHYPSSIDLVSDKLSLAMKNPFIPGGPVVQDAGGADVAGVVEYDIQDPYHSYTIRGLGKDANPVNLILLPAFGD